MTRPSSSQELWIAEPTSGEFVPGVAVLPIAGGLEAKLTPTQLNLIQSLDTNLANIQALLTDEDGQSFADLQAAMGILMSQNTAVATTIRDRIEQIKALLTGSGNVGIASRTDEISSRLQSILNRLDGNLTTLQGSGLQANLNNSDPILNAVTGDSSSSVIAIPDGSLKIGLQAYFSSSSATATIAIEFHRIANAVNLSDRRIYYYQLTAGDVALAIGNYAANAISSEPDGSVEMIVHLRSLSAGNCSVYAWEVS